MDRAGPTGGTTDPDGAHRVPPIVSAGSIVAVLAVNLAILVYAVRIGLPGEGRAAAVPTAMGSFDTAEPLGELLAAVPPLDEAVDLDEGWDDDEWVYEELPVVNPFELPAPQETRSVFLRQCAICHGVEGRGDGAVADLLLPRPRDFGGSPFRYASPGADKEHVIAGLERTIAQGIPRSAMPGFQGVLTEAQRAGLARYVLALRTDEPPAYGVADVGVRPPLTPQLVARGRELYAKLSCNTCHGDSGRGDGINSTSLVDSQDKPVRPADFTLGLFKSGQAPEDLCRTILRGIPGTPMVAYESILAVENPDEESQNVMDAWALVAYIRSFSPTPAHIGASSGAELIVQPAPAKSMISDPSHVAWLGVPPTRITIKPLSARQEHTTCLEVRVVRTRERIALALDWNDETIDLSRSAGLYSDAVAVMFGLGDDVPPLPMCRELKGVPSGRPAYFWHWKADRQYDAAMGRRHLEITLDDSQPNDWYLFVPGPHSRLPLVSTDTQQALRNGSGPDDERTPEHAVEEANATSVGSITPQPSGNQDARAFSAWSNGLWRVVLMRALSTTDESDAQFASPARIPVSFAVFDGAKGDHAASKLVSGWHWLVVEVESAAELGSVPRASDYKSAATP